MKRSKILLGSAALAFTLAGCDSLKEAFTAHVDTVAKAQGQELSTERLAVLIGNSQIPVRKDITTTVADFWVNYQLLGYAGAHGDTLSDSTTKNWWVSDKTAIDKAMWSAVMGARTRVFFDKISKTWAPDTSNLEQKYTQGTALAAQHILVLFPDGGRGMTKPKEDEFRRKAEGIRAKVTAANFNALVKQYSEDEGSKQNNGSYVFNPGAMVPEFENAARSVKPGEIAPGVIKTTYGYHIVRRHTLDEIRQQYIDHLVKENAGVAQNAYIEKLRADWKVVVKPEAPAKSKEVGANPPAFRNDKTVLVTSRVGDFTAARLSEWIDVIPVQFQIRERFAQSPDSLVVKLLQSIVDQEILNAQAEKEGVKPDSGEIAEIRRGFTTMVQSSMAGLGVDPRTLADSAKSTGDKERLAAKRVEIAIDNVFKNGGQGMVEIPPQLGAALRERYSSRVNDVGVDRTIERANAIRAGVDSVRAKNAPPMPTPEPVPPPTGGTGRGRGN